MADVGLIGYPSAGKSSLVAAISAARPKIADYPFTTLEPNLGVVRLDDAFEMVVADVPGRCEPGTGEINYRAVATALDAAGYTGVVGLEAWAKTDPDGALDAFEQAFTVG